MLPDGENDTARQNIIDKTSQRTEDSAQCAVMIKQMVLRLGQLRKSVYTKIYIHSKV